MGSNTGQTVLMVAGTVIGSYFGYPGLGLTLGSLVGQAAFPTQLDPLVGPRLDDLNVQSSAVGAPVPIVYGTFTLAGNIIWTSGIIETKNKTRVGGKGTPEQTVTEYTYKVNCAIGICEGEIAGIRRVWANEALIYDARERQPDENDAEYVDRLAANAELAMQVRIGDESQEPDEVIESWKGPGNVPAYRGLAYVIFENFELAGYGNRVPSFRFEVNAVTATTNVEYAGTVFPTWSSNTTDPRRDGDSYEYALGEIPDGALDTWIGPAGWTTDISAVQNGVQGRTGEYGYIVGYITTAAGTVLASQGGPVVGDGTADSDDLYGPYFIAGYGTGPIDNSGATCTAFNAMGLTYTGAAGWTANFATGASNNKFSYGERAPLGFLPEPVPDWARNITQSCGTGSTDETRGIYYQPSMSIRVRRVETGPIQDAGLPWIEDSGGTYRRLQNLNITGTTGQEYVNKYPLDPSLPSTHPDYSNQTFWEAAYADAVAAGDMPSGLTYGVDYPVIASNSTWYRESVEVGLSVAKAGDVIRDICKRCGIPDANIVTADLTQEMTGYCVSRPMTGRAAIDPLRVYTSFDCVESGLQLKFPARGRTEVAGITYHDLAAHEGSSGQPPVMEVKRKQDVDLPRTMRISYISYARDYEAGQQYASRLVTGAVASVDLQAPIVMTDDEAIQRADVHLYQAWTERNAYRFFLGQEFIDLEPSDCITIPVDGVEERVRIISTQLNLPGILEVEAVRDDATNYVSTRTAPWIPQLVSPIQTTGNTTAVLLDIPALDPSHNDAGYYVAVTGSGIAWSGAYSYTSVDGGDVYELTATVPGDALLSTIQNTVPAGITTTWDEVNEIVIDAPADAQLESRNAQAIYEGANLAAIGAAGRWEIIQFATATYEGSPPQWVLRNLLRGRRGTEHNAGKTIAGDTFVLLSQAVRVPILNTKYGQEHLIKTFSIGKSLDAVTGVAFTSQAEALKPFSPVALEGTRDGSQNLTLSWIRRDRLYGELVSGTDLPLSEASEQYEIDIIDGGAVVRTLTASGSPTVTYSAVQQETDFGSPIPESVVVRVYQISAVVGRGYVLEGVV